MKRNISCIDIETTEVDKHRARIIQLAVVVFNPDTFKRVKEKSWYIKPTGKWEMTPNAIDIHGLTREFIESSGENLADIAQDFKDMIEDTDILTYNGTNFDIVILEWEFERIKFNLELDNHNFIDACDIERRSHSNKLIDAYHRYYGKDFEGAHDAFADVQATIDVYKAQTERLDEAIIAESNETNSDAVKTSPDGFVMHNEDGKLVFRIGKYRDQSTVDVCLKDPGYIQWLFGSTRGVRNITIPTQKAIQKEWLEYKESLKRKTNN